jgi:hypothetical protein
MDHGERATAAMVHLKHQFLVSARAVIMGENS